MESILNKVDNLSVVADEPFSSVQEETLVNLHSLINGALPGFLDTKSKRDTIEVISSCIRKYKEHADIVIIKELQNIVNEYKLNQSSRILLAFMDGPRNLKRCVLSNPKFFCDYLVRVLETSSHMLLKDSEIESGDSDSSFEERLFNGIKVCQSMYTIGNSSSLRLLCVHMLQIVGDEIIKKVFATDTECNWERKWACQVITHLISVIKSKNNHDSCHVFCKDYSSFAHPVKFEEPDTRIWPIIIPADYLQNGSSELSLIAVINGFVTVCNSKILLERVIWDENFMDEEILNHLFTTLYTACTTSVDTEHKYYSFQVLNAWLDTVSRITLEEYHAGGERKPMFMTSSSVCKKLLHLIWENREDMTDGVPKIVVSIFGKVIMLHQKERTLLGTLSKDNEFIGSMLAQLLADPWYIKGRYTLLCELLHHVSPDQDWTGDYWASIFQKHFVEMLISRKTRSTEACALYFIPTTLQKIPSTFYILRDAVLEAIELTNSKNRQSVQERNRIRRNLSFAYCTVLKIGRKNGLASFEDVNYNVLNECLGHMNDELRAEALSLLCHNNKTTEPVNAQEQMLVLEFVKNNLNCASSAFRQTLFVSMKILMARLRDSCIMLLREYKKSKKALARKDHFVQPPETFTSSIEMVEDLFSLSISCQFPGASFQRRKTGLQLCHTILETFSSPKDAVKRGRTAESLKNLADWVKTNGKWEFVTKRNLEILVSCFEDQHDEIRESALEILKWFHFDTVGMTDKETKEFGIKLMGQTYQLLKSPRIRDAESGTILLEFVTSRFLKWDAVSVFEDGSSLEKSFDEIEDPSKFSSLLHVMFSLFHITNKHIDEAYHDFLHASIQQPVFGFVMAARRCFTLVLHHLSTMGRISCKTESQSEVLGSLVKESVKICRRVTLLAMFTFKKETGEKEGGSPSFADMSDSLNETLKKCASFKSLEEQIGYQHCSELLASFCWLNIKASTLFLGEIGRIMTLEWLDLSLRKQFLSDEIFNQIGDIFRETLVQCRHKGVIENSNVGFQMLCKSVASISSMTNILNDWIEDTIDAVDRNDFNSSVTKRSAGLPMFLQPLISACISSRRFDFAAYIEKLIDIAKRPLPSSEEEQSDLPQVQALNILKTMYRDSWLGNEALKYAQDGLMLSVEGFSSHSWAIRNAAQILLGALVPRMFGQRVTQADKWHHNSLSTTMFFKMYPKLEDFFIEKLQSEGVFDQKVNSLSSLIPILTMLSRLRPCDYELVQSDFCPLLKRLIDCPVYTVRELAAGSLVQFLPTVEVFGFIDMLIKDATSLNENLKHGIMLIIKHLIEVQDDDKRVSDGVTAKMLLAVSGSLLGSGICATLATCTLLEIFKIILPKLCESTNNDDILLRDYIKTSLEVTLASMTDVCKTDLEPGIYLFLRRLAQLVVCSVLHWQNVDNSFASNLLSNALSPKNHTLLLEMANELTRYLKEGHFFEMSLRHDIFRKIYEQISFLKDSEFQSKMMQCCFYALKGIEIFNLPIESTSSLLSSYLNLNISGASQRYLASFLPFTGMVLKHLDPTSIASGSVFVEISNLWSEMVMNFSQPDEGETLRWSSVKAVQCSIESFLKLFKSNNDADVSPRFDSVATVCARLIMAALTLIQDEDENIRNAATDIAVAISQLNGRAAWDQLQPNLAMKLVLNYIKDNMQNNAVLFEMLFESLSGLVGPEVNPNEDTRSTLLFEQESANLFAEKAVYAKQVMGLFEELGNHFRTSQHESSLQKVTGCIKHFAEQFISKSKFWADDNKDVKEDCRFPTYFDETCNPKIFLFLTVAFGILQMADSVAANDVVAKINELIHTISKGKDQHPFLENEHRMGFGNIHEQSK
eukprot:gene3434-1806_t